ncbi:MAG: dimethyladenosine transferase [Sneathiella sp.]|nr:MAG: dimethyladenosine transferase [Sneathiella sp.]
MKRIGALVFPNFELLDLFGPLEFFGIPSDAFHIEIVAEKKGYVVSKAGPAVKVERCLADQVNYDLILIPGGLGTRQEVDNPALLAWIAAAAVQAETVMTVCTGSALLAKIGVLDGRQATSNKLAFDWVRAQSSEVDWVVQARWVEDGKFFTSSGVSAGMDMALAVIARHCGLERARKVAVWAEYEWQEDSSRDPFAKIHNLV